MELINLDEREREGEDLLDYLIFTKMIFLQRNPTNLRLPIFLFFDYFEIQSNHFRMSIEVLVIFVFQIPHIVLIFVSENRQIVRILSKFVLLSLFT